jgi:hypothetical protein
LEKAKGNLVLYSAFYMSRILPVFQNAKEKFKAEMTTGEMVHSPTTYMTILLPHLDHCSICNNQLLIT